MTSSTKLLLVALSGLLSLSLLACPADDPAPPECVASLCVAGQTECKGNYARTCDADGTAWLVTACGPTAYCAGGACRDREECLVLGPACDADGATLWTCDITGKHSAACPSGQICPPTGDACAPQVCAGVEQRCGERTVLTCAAGAWQVTSCGAAEVCSEVGGVPTCVAQTCGPQFAWCTAGVAHVCALDGRSMSSESCGLGETCKSGFCQPIVCGVDDKPAAGADASGVTDGSSVADSGAPAGDAPAADGPGPEPEVYIPPLEPIGTIAFELGGVPNKFDLNAQAIFVAADQQLKISAGKNNRRIEFNVAPVEELIVGKWTDTDTSEVTVTVCYHDGSLVQEVQGCTVGFSHSSILYDVTVDKNNGPGSWVEGAFEVTLRSDAGQELALQGGTFKVKRK